LLRGGVKEDIEVGGGIARLTLAGRDRDKTVVEKNPKILFDGRPAQFEFFGNGANAGVADTSLAVSEACQHVIYRNTNSADLLAVVINNDIVYAICIGAGLKPGDCRHETCSP
jgi:hypothetical protein